MNILRKENGEINTSMAYRIYGLFLVAMCFVFVCIFDEYEAVKNASIVIFSLEVFFFIVNFWRFIYKKDRTLFGMRFDNSKCSYEEMNKKTCAFVCSIMWSVPFVNFVFTIVIFVICVLVVIIRSVMRKRYGDKWDF